MSYDDIHPRPRKRFVSKGSANPDPNNADASTRADEKVGYCNPPRQHRWQKGTSGNPKGKVRGTKSLGTWIDHEMGVEVEVTERGKKRKYPKIRVAAMRIVNKAVEGDDKALTVLLRREGNISLASPSIQSASQEPVSQAEQSILDHFMNAARVAAERERREKGE